MKTYRQLLEDIELIGVTRRNKQDDYDDEEEFRHGYGKARNLGKIHKDYSLHKKAGDFYITHDKSNKVVGRIQNDENTGKNVRVNMVSIHPEHTKKKIGHSIAIAAYKHLHKTGHTIHSGVQQSPGGASIWQKLMSDPSTKRHVHAVHRPYNDRRTHRSLGQASKLKTGDIWTSGSREARRAGRKKGIQMHKYGSSEAEKAHDVQLVLKPRGKR